MNNLYGASMAERISSHDYEWLSEDEIHQLYISTLDDDAELGYILEVDLRYS